MPSSDKAHYLAVPSPFDAWVLPARNVVEHCSVFPDKIVPVNFFIFPLGAMKYHSSMAAVEDRTSEGMIFNVTATAAISALFWE